MWPFFPNSGDATKAQTGAILGLGQDHTVTDGQAETVPDLLILTAELFPHHDTGLVGGLVCFFNHH